MSFFIGATIMRISSKLPDYDWNWKLYQYGLKLTFSDRVRTMMKRYSKTLDYLAKH